MKKNNLIFGSLLTSFLAVTGLSIQTAQAQVRTLGASNQNAPAYYVDGVLTPNEALNNTKPEDIEAINVVKDKMAVAAFGPAATNGAIIITTKKNKDSEAVKAFNRAHNISYTPASPEVKKLTDAVANGTGLSADDLAGRLLIVNGQEAKPEASKIAPDKLSTVYVLSAEKATERYGAKGSKGAVVISTK